MRAECTVSFRGIFPGTSNKKLADHWLGTKYHEIDSKAPSLFKDVLKSYVIMLEAISSSQSISPNKQ